MSLTVRRGKYSLEYNVGKKDYAMYSYSVLNYLGLEIDHCEFIIDCTHGEM